MKTAIIKNNKGIAEVALLGYVIGALVLFFVPNPISSAVGIGVRPNKTVLKDTYKETVDLIKDKDGNIIGQRTVSQSALSDVDEQQRVTLWEQISSLPIFLLVLVILGGLFPPLGIALAAIWKNAKKAVNKIAGEKEVVMSDTKKIVMGLERAFATVPLTLAGTNLPGEIDRAALARKIVDEMKWELGDYYNDSTKALVKSFKS